MRPVWFIIAALLVVRTDAGLGISPTILSETILDVPGRVRVDPSVKNENKDHGLLSDLFPTNGGEVSRLLDLLEPLKARPVPENGDRNKMVIELFNDAKFKGWVEQCKKALYPGPRDHVIFLGLQQLALRGSEDLDKNGYDIYTRVAKMIQVARDEDQTKKLAKKLEQIQFRRWQIRKVDADRVLNPKGEPPHDPADPTPKPGWNEAMYNRYKKFLAPGYFDWLWNYLK